MYRHSLKTITAQVSGHLFDRTFWLFTSSSPDNKKHNLKRVGLGFAIKREI